MNLKISLISYRQFCPQTSGGTVWGSNSHCLYRLFSTCVSNVSSLFPRPKITFLNVQQHIFLCFQLYFLFIIHFRT